MKCLKFFGVWFGLWWCIQAAPKKLGMRSLKKGYGTKFLDPKVRTKSKLKKTLACKGLHPKDVWNYRDETIAHTMQQLWQRRGGLLTVLGNDSEKVLLRWSTCTDSWSLEKAKSSLWYGTWSLQRAWSRNAKLARGSKQKLKSFRTYNSPKFLPKTCFSCCSFEFGSNVLNMFQT